jgi:hypothetical protein
MADNNSALKTVILGGRSGEETELQDLASAINAAPGQKSKWNIVIFLDKYESVAFPGFTVHPTHSWPQGLDWDGPKVTNNGVEWYDQCRPCVFKLKDGAGNEYDPVIIPK